MKGADWLKKLRRRRPRRIESPRWECLSISFADLLEARKTGRFFAPPCGSSSTLTDGEEKVQYQLVPERDINGVGLSYSANYPVITDIRERIALTRVLGDTDCTAELMARRTVMRRRGGCFGNAGVRDSLRVGISAWARSEGNEKDGFDHHLVVEQSDPPGLRRTAHACDVHGGEDSSCIERGILVRSVHAEGRPFRGDCREPSSRCSGSDSVEHLDANEVVILCAAERTWTPGDSVAFRVDAPNGATECRATVESVRNERTGVRVTLRLVDPSSPSSLADYVDSAVLRQLYPPSSLKVTLR